MYPIQRRRRSTKLRLLFLIPVLYLIVSFLNGTKNSNAEEDQGNAFERKGRHILATEDMQLPKPLDCIPPSIDDFPGDFFTQEQRLRGGVVLHFLITAYVCAALAIVCDEYFVPSLEVITDYFGMPTDVAGATFMAIGTSAPELFSSVIGSFITEGDIGIGTIVGSAVFNILAVTSLAGFVVWNADVDIDWYPISRDCIIYAITVAALVGVIYDSIVMWWEALILMLIYAGYILLMYFNTRVEGASVRKVEYLKMWWSERGEKQHDLVGKPPDETTPLLNGSHHQHEETQSPQIVIANGEHNKDEHTKDELVNSHDSHMSRVSLHSSLGPQSRKESQIISEDVKHMESEVEVSLWSMPAHGVCQKFWWILMWPMSLLFFITIPDCQKPRLRKFFLITFATSVAWIAILTYLGVWMVTIIGYTLSIPDTVSGITLLAAGTSIPEIISSVIVVRNGLGNMAICNLIGSNVFDILMCLGLPWLVKTAFVSKGGYLIINSSAMTYTTITLLATVAILFITFILSRWKLNKNVGITCLVLYLAFITLACMYELNVFMDINPPPCPR